MNSKPSERFAEEFHGTIQKSPRLTPAEITAMAKDLPTAARADVAAALRLDDVSAARAVLVHYGML